MFTTGERISRVKERRDAEDAPVISNPPASSHGTKSMTFGPSAVRRGVFNMTEKEGPP